MKAIRRTLSGLLFVTLALMISTSAPAQTQVMSSQSQVSGSMGFTLEKGTNQSGLSQSVRFYRGKTMIYETTRGAGTFPVPQPSDFSDWTGMKAEFSSNIITPGPNLREGTRLLLEIDSSAQLGSQIFRLRELKDFVSKLTDQEWEQLCEGQVLCDEKTEWLSIRLDRWRGLTVYFDLSTDEAAWRALSILAANHHFTADKDRLTTNLPGIGKVQPQPSKNSWHNTAGWMEGRVFSLNLTHPTDSELYWACALHLGGGATVAVGEIRPGFLPLTPLHETRLGSMFTQPGVGQQVIPDGDEDEDEDVDTSTSKDPNKSKLGDKKNFENEMFGKGGNSGADPFQVIWKDKTTFCIEARECDMTLVYRTAGNETMQTYKDGKPHKKVNEYPVDLAKGKTSFPFWNYDKFPSLRVTASYIGKDGKRVEREIPLKREGR